MPVSLWRCHITNCYFSLFLIVFWYICSVNAIGVQRARIRSFYSCLTMFIFFDFILVLHSCVLANEFTLTVKLRAYTKNSKWFKNRIQSIECSKRPKMAKDEQDVMFILFYSLVGNFWFYLFNVVDFLFGFWHLSLGACLNTCVCWCTVCMFHCKSYI